MDRAARHVALPQIGREGQAKIASATILVVGLGGTGSAASIYLACAGAGHLLLNDFDTVDETNLGRQILYGAADVGAAKADLAAARLEALNPAVRCSVLGERLADADLDGAVGQADIVLDCTDNFQTRFRINAAAVRRSRALVSGAAIRFEGQVAVFGPDYADSPCYRCLYGEADESLENCAGNGVLSPVPGVVGTMMATEALKLAAGLPVATGRLQVFDALASEWWSLGVPKRANCETCGGRQGTAGSAAT